MPKNTKHQSSNKIVTDEMADEAAAALNASLGRLNGGLPVDSLRAAATLAVWHIERGARRFADFVHSFLANARLNDQRRARISLGA